MRRAILVAGVICCCVLAAAPFAQQKDAAAVLAEMRQALGGAAVLDGVKTFSINGSRTLNTPVGSRRLSLEWLAILPDHFLEVRRDSTGGPVPIDIVYYKGLAGSRVIRKTDASGLAFPETKYVDNSPAAIAAREKVALLAQARAYARILLVLTGTSTSVYPLQFSYVGVEHAEGKSYDVIDATGPDGVTARLHVDAVTHLPAMLTWLEELPYVLSTTSIVTTTSVVKVPSGTMPPVLPPSAPSVPAPQPTSTARRGMGQSRWLLQEFKVQDGVNWPRVIEEEFDGKTEEIRLGRLKINPKLDARKFDIR
jgi:hypothetical protein